MQEQRCLYFFLWKILLTSTAFTNQAKSEVEEWRPDSLPYIKSEQATIISMADGDPDFLVRVNGLETPLCFHIDGEPGDVVRFVQDQNAGLFVNAKLVENNDTGKRYIGVVSILHRGIQIVAYRSRVFVTKHPFDWGNFSAFMVRGHRVVIGGDMAAITLRRVNITLVIRRHQLTSSDGIFRFFGLYVTDSRGLSPLCHGLLGQFLHKRATLENIKYRGGKIKGRLRVISPGTGDNVRRVLAVLSHRENMALNITTTCWFIRHGGRGFVDGAYANYLVQDIKDKHMLSFE